VLSWTARDSRIFEITSVYDDWCLPRLRQIARAGGIYRQKFTRKPLWTFWSARLRVKTNPNRVRSYTTGTRWFSLFKAVSVFKVFDMLLSFDSTMLKRQLTVEHGRCTKIVFETFPNATRRKTLRNDRLARRLIVLKKTDYGDSFFLLPKFKTQIQTSTYFNCYVAI